MKYRFAFERLTIAMLVVAFLASVLLISTYVFKEAFNWLIFERIGESFYLLSIGILFASVSALSLLNMALNAGIAVRILRESIHGEAMKVELGRLVMRLGLALVASVFGLIIALFAVNRFNVDEKIEEMKVEMSTAIGSNPNGFAALTQAFVEKKHPEKIPKLLKEVRSTSPYFRGLQVIVPIKTTAGRYAYRLIEPEHDWRIKSLFDPTADFQLFSPTKAELEYLEKCMDHGPCPPEVFVKRPVFRLFYPISDNELPVLFLYSDRHVYGRKEIK